jgi:protein-S-isoprenylcysteine O-methyltransferase
MRKFIVGLVACLAVFILPAALGNPEALSAPQLWILVGVGLFASVTQPAYKPIDRSGPPEDRGTATQIVWTVYLTQFMGVIESVFFRYPESLAWTPLTSAMLVLTVAGALFRAWAVSELGKFFTWHVRVQEGQKVISTGPYRLVRHPSYTGAIFLYVGTLLFLQAWVAAMLALVFMVLAFSRRIRYEEGLLVSSLGQEYQDYCGRVKRLVPLVW